MMGRFNSQCAVHVRALPECLSLGARRAIILDGAPNIRVALAATDPAVRTAYEEIARIWREMAERAERHKW
jgi:hypothetical protein